MHTYEYAFLEAWGITVVVETAVLLLLNYWQKSAKITDVMVAGVVSSSLTIPYLWFVMPIFFDSRTLYVYTSECLIILIEALILYKFLPLSLKQAFVVSLIANLASIGVGFLR